jgi:hypothetical protein
MFGATLTELLLFGKQFGIAVAGAAGLWGLVLSRKDFHCKTDQACIIYDWISVRILPLYLFGLFVGTGSYLWLTSVLPARAHEGITLYPNQAEIIASYEFLTPLFFALLLITALTLLFPKKDGERFADWMSAFYGVAFVLCFLITAIPAWRGGVDGQQIFYIGHGFHSIFTVGSVLVLDYLFLLGKRAQILKEHIVDLFPTISLVVWVGLAFDFISALLIIDGFTPTTKFLFLQTVIGILIINGVLLSGPIARKMLASTHTLNELSGRWRIGANLAGTISAVSWTTITLVDEFQELTLGFTELFGIYGLIIALVFAGHELVEWYVSRNKPPAFVRDSGV